jgi:hypothetical protein
VAAGSAHGGTHNVKDGIAGAEMQGSAGSRGRRCRLGSDSRHQRRAMAHGHLRHVRHKIVQNAGRVFADDQVRRMGPDADKVLVENRNGPAGRRGVPVAAVVAVVASSKMGIYRVDRRPLTRSPTTSL